MEAELPPSIFNVVFDIFFKAPVYVIFLEVSLLLMVIWILIHKQQNGKELTPEQKQEIISKWKQEPLVPEVPLDHPALKNRIVDGPVGKYIFVDGHKCLNMSTHNYLGLGEDHPEIKEATINTVKKYGVGSCGPRGFYGTVDVHLELEEKIAKFMQQEEAVVYSYGFSTMASAIPAYSKRTDVIFV